MQWMKMHKWNRLEPHTQRIEEWEGWNQGRKLDFYGKGWEELREIEENSRREFGMNRVDPRIYIEPMVSIDLGDIEF